MIPNTCLGKLINRIICLVSTFEAVKASQIIVIESFELMMWKDSKRFRGWRWKTKRAILKPFQLNNAEQKRQ